MPLTPEQIAAVSAKLPGWTMQQYAGQTSWASAGNAMVTHYTRPIGEMRVSVAVHMDWMASDWPRVRALGDQAAAAAKLMEQFAKENQL